MVRVSRSRYRGCLFAYFAVLAVLIGGGSLAVAAAWLKFPAAGRDTPVVATAEERATPDAGGALAGTPGAPQITATTAVTPWPTATPVLPTATEDTSRVDSMLAGMELRAKIGQLFMVGIDGTRYTDSTAAIARDLLPGGIALRGQNAYSPEQVRSLATALQDAMAGRSGAPLFVAIDHEGGSVVRFQTGVTTFPGNLAVGATYDAEEAYRVALYSGLELANAGINMILGPVVDVEDNPDNTVIGIRAFGGYPQCVAALGDQAILGYHAAGLATVAKHFPGHGGVSIDSHVALPEDDRDRQTLEARSLPPFVGARDAGTDGIMLAHLSVPAFDPSGEPATVSRPMVADLLRGEIGFDGIVMTDSMGMGAITSKHPLGEASVLAVQAGVDMILATTPELGYAVQAALTRAVQSGLISPEQIEAAARRVLLAKMRRGFLDQPTLPITAFDQNQHLQLAESLGRASLAFAGAEWSPISNGSKLLLLTPTRLRTGSGYDPLSLLGEALKGRGVAVTELQYAVGNAMAIAGYAARVASQNDAVVVVTWDAGPQADEFADRSQVALVEQMMAMGKPLAVAAVRTPFDIEQVPGIQAYFATFGTTEAQLRALAGGLAGEFTLAGQWPVPLASLGVTAPPPANGLCGS